MEKIDPEAPPEIKTKLPKNIDYEFAVWMKTNNYAIGTIKNYHISILNLLKKDDYISPEKIKKYLSIKNSLVKRSSIRLFLVFLEDMHQIKIAPFRYTRLKTNTPVLEALGKESFEKILEALDPRLRLFAKTMYYSALRISEVVRIRSEWFDWHKWFENKEDYGDLKIIKAKRNKDRIVPIHPRLMQEIYDSIPKHEDTGALKKCLVFDLFKHDLYIFRKKRKGIPEEVAESKYVAKSSAFFQRELRVASEKAIGKKIKTHILRASRATHLDESGVQPSAIQYLLGHDNLSTTSRYIINTSEKLKKAIKKADDYN